MAHTPLPPAASDELHAPYAEWLNVERDAPEALGAEERRRLADHLSGCPACRAERESLARLDALLAAERIEVRADFASSVMAALPAAGWEGRSRAAWRLPLAVALMLALAAGALFSTGAGAGGGLPAIAAALADLAASAVLAGSGLLWASWRGLSLALDRALAGGAAVAFLVLVVSVDLLLASYLLRRRRRMAEAAEAAESGGTRGGRR